MSSGNNPNALSTAPIGKLLIQYSIPAIIGMTIVSLYHIIDSIFIGHGVGPMAISGLAITFPLMNLAMAFCTLISSGASALASIRLGQKDLKGATDVLGNAFMICLINSILLSILSYFFLDKILFYFGASEATLPYARDFMRVILMGLPISHVMIGMNNIMRATGYPAKAMLTSIVSVLTNVILAPIFIFYFHLGIGGAAMATLLAQSVALVWVLNHFIRKSSYVHLTRNFWKMKPAIIGNIFSIGMSPFLMNVCSCAIIIVINNSLQEHGGDFAVGAYGIINRLLTFFFMVVLGLSMGMQPIAGYNYGALKMPRVQQILKLGIIAGVLITGVGTFFFELFPYVISGFFTESEELIGITAPGLRICALMLPLVGCQVVIANFFQSIGKAKISVFLGLSRQLVYFLPLLLILPHYFGQRGIWAAIPISDFLGFVTTVICLLIYLKKLKSNIEVI
ncbi:Multidrug export protein MepA [termite gut metagenome]|uniref:Multidrug export protein MepA n=1 Tax=termite gut metagenome TaxID=433724 RepID=A0A5J4QK45_9ZZZZ